MPDSGETIGLGLLMRNLLIIIVSLLLGVLPAFSLTPAPKKVAVYVTGPESKEERSIIESAVQSRLSGNRDYKVFERNSAFVKALDKEEGYQLSGEVAEREIRKLGERFGVDYLIIVWVNIDDDNICDMSARLEDLSSGEILKNVSLQRECSDSKELRNMANGVAYRLLDKKSK